MIAATELARCALWAALAMAAAPANAAPPAEVHVRFSERQLPGAEGCVAPAALRGQIAILLGYDPFAGSIQTASAARNLAVEVRPRPPGFEATVTLRGEDGRTLGGRTLSGGPSECAELTSSLALAIGNAIDPVRANRTAPRLPNPPPQATPEPPTVAAAPPPPPRPGSKPSLLGSLGVVGAEGAAPGLNAGATLELELRWPRYSLSLGGRADFPATMGWQGGSISGQLLVGEVAPCLWLWRFGACLLAALGSESAQGSGFPGAAQQTAFYAGAGARALFDLIEPGPVGLRLGADLLAPITREDFLAAGALAYATPPVALALSLSGVLRVF
ncbi:MAG: hypothetical protein ACYDCL_10020 [Myxococcales bacterium]